MNCPFPFTVACSFCASVYSLSANTQSGKRNLFRENRENGRGHQDHPCWQTSRGDFKKAVERRAAWRARHAFAPTNVRANSTTPCGPSRGRKCGETRSLARPARSGSWTETMAGQRPR